jgi:hypothetical protein
MTIDETSPERCAGPGTPGPTDQDPAAPGHLAAALQALADSLGTEEFGSESSLSCSEADALARLLYLAGHDGPAAWLLAGHTLDGDDDGDRHHHIVFTDGREDHLDATAALAYLAALAAGVEPLHRYRCRCCQGLYGPGDAGDAGDAEFCPTCTARDAADRGVSS